MTYCIIRTYSLFFLASVNVVFCHTMLLICELSFLLGYLNTVLLWIRDPSIQLLFAFSPSLNCFSTPFTDNRKNTTMKIVVKGVMTVEDALASVRHGVDGIWVSNHGARQLDTTPATIEVFNYVCKSVCLSGYSPYISTFSTLFFHFFCQTDFFSCEIWSLMTFVSNFILNHHHTLRILIH